MKTNLLRIYLALFTLALTIGTAFAQDGEEVVNSTGPTILVLFLGLGAIGALFVINWAQSAPEDSEDETA